jgi:hypothetical protein
MSVKAALLWAANPGGTVRQLWESTDAEGRWGTVSDGTYTRK